MRSISARAAAQLCTFSSGLLDLLFLHLHFCFLLSLCCDFSEDTHKAFTYLLIRAGGSFSILEAVLLSLGWEDYRSSSAATVLLRHRWERRMGLHRDGTGTMLRAILGPGLSGRIA